MKKAAITLSSIAVTLTLLLVPVTPASFAQSGGRGGGIGAGGGAPGPGGAVPGGGGRGGGIRGGHRDSFGPRHHHHFRHKHFFGHHRHKFFGFGLGASVFVPAWWWYSPYYYWNPPPAYNTGYYGYPYYDNYYDYYGSPYWSDPCLSSDPAYAPYCPPAGTGYPYGGEYGAPPVDYPAPEAPAQPETGGVSLPATPAEQPASSGY